MRFDHLGVVVNDLGKGRKHLASGIGIERWTEIFRDTINGVAVQFGIDAAGICYELIEPLDETSPVYSALKSSKAILNHVAYRVPDLAPWQDKLKMAGWVRTADPKPAIAYGGRPIQFFISPLRFIIELIEAYDHEHLYTRELQQFS